MIPITIPNPVKNFESLISLDRLQYIMLHIKPLCDVRLGDICEIGVYRGGSLARIAQLFPKKKVCGIDTFEGLPETSDRDKVKNLDEFTGHKKGDFSDVTFDELDKSFKKWFKNVELIKGFFPNKKILDRLESKLFCFVHVDCDLYQSVKNCCEYFFPRLENKGVMLFDDYGFDSTPGAKIAVDEYFSDKANCIKKALPTKQFFVYKKEKRKH